MTTGLTCYVHPEAAARDRCGACNRTICAVCVVEIEHRTVCRSCADRAAARRGRIKLAIVAAVLTTSAGTLWFLFLRSAGDGGSAATSRPDAGPPAEMLAEMATMRRNLAADPCDTDSARQLGGMQNALGQYAATVALVDRTVARCGASPGLYQATLYALEKMKNWDQAVALTSELIAEYPMMPDYWAWRGDALAGKGELEQSAFDYRQSLALQPNTAVVKFADLARKRDRPCEGVYAVTRFIDQVASTRAWVHDLRHDLYVEGDCGTHLGKGTGAVPEPGRVRATVGGAGGQFHVRERVPHLVVTRAFAERAGLRMTNAPAITILIDEALVTASIAAVDRVETGGVSASGFEAAVVDELAPFGGKPVDGIIGLDFFWRFDARWRNHKIELRPLVIAL